MSGLQNPTVLIVTGGSFTGKCTAGTNVAAVVCQSVSGGVRVNITTNGGSTADTTRYDLMVSMMTPSYVGTQSLTLTTYSSDGVYSMQTGSLSLSANQPNILNLNVSQSAPYLK